jgi:hypothetical protein
MPKQRVFRRMPRHSVVQPLDPSYRIIALTQGQSTKVDAADYLWLNQWNWCAHWAPHTHSFYAIRRKTIDGKSQTVQMHREILSCGPNIEVDHWNHDTLDNRRKNLRKATTLQNTRNQKLRITNTSGFTGVVKRGNKWIAQLSGYHIGIFNTIKKAVKARDKMAKKIYGEFASLNQKICRPQNLR